MRTTLAIDDDVLSAARAIANQQGKSIGEVVSDLARTGLKRPKAGKARNGIPLLTRQTGAELITLDIVNTLRDETP